MKINPSKKSLFDMASTMGGSDTPTEELITGAHDEAYLQSLSEQFGLTLTKTSQGTLVHS